MDQRMSGVKGAWVKTKNPTPSYMHSFGHNAISRSLCDQCHCFPYHDMYKSPLREGASARFVCLFAIRTARDCGDCVQVVIQAVTAGSHFLQDFNPSPRMGGFLAPDPMNGFTNCMHAFAFIRPLRKESKQALTPKRKTRQQDRRASKPDVASSRQLPTPLTGLGTVSIVPVQIRASHHTVPLTPPSRGRRKLCKTRAVRKKSRSTPFPVATQSKAAPLNGHTVTPSPLPPRSKDEVEPQQHIVVDSALLSPATSSAIASNLDRADNEHREANGGNTDQNGAELRDALSALHPRLPHQRMQYLRRLGQGGEGHIDLFRLHSPPQSILAVKTLKRTPDLIRYRNNKRKPLEAYILQDLLPAPHPHIVQMFGYTYTPRKTMFFFEYCSLGDLQDVVENYFTRSIAIPEGFIWHVFSAIAKALAYLHTGYIAQSSSDFSTQDTDETSLQILNRSWTPILHRDIKPENIFLRQSPSSPYPTPLLADFGLATHYTPKPYECSGTFIYQGPEIPIQTPASDL
ncbi:MAG: hypothetical protein Q9172_007764, partial [Xanthocarpia lactea]